MKDSFDTAPYGALILRNALGIMFIAHALLKILFQYLSAWEYIPACKRSLEFIDTDLAKIDVIT